MLFCGGPLVLVAINTATSAGGPDTCARIRGDTQARQPCGRRRGGSPIADPRRARVRSGPRLRRRSSSTMLTGIAFVVAPSIRGRRARRIRGRIYGHEYLGTLLAPARLGGDPLDAARFIDDPLEEAPDARRVERSRVAPDHRPDDLLLPLRVV